MSKKELFHSTVRQLVDILKSLSQDLPVLLKNNSKDLLLELLEILLEYRIDDNRHSEKYMPIVDSYWLKEALKHHKNSIAQLCALEAAEMIDCFVVDNYKPIMGILELFYVDGRILCIEFLYVQCQLF
jgi:hypothetical protein